MREIAITVTTGVLGLLTNEYVLAFWLKVLA